MHLHGARRKGLFGVDDDRQLLVVDDDQFRRILGNVFVAGDDDRDRIAVVLDLVDRQRPVLGVLRRSGSAASTGWRRDLTFAFISCR